ISSSVHPSIRTREELTIFIDSVKVTFLEYPYPVYENFVSWRNINLLPVSEIAATKAYTIGRRGSWKDYVDLYWVLKENHITLPALCRLAEKKYESNFNTRLFLEQLIYFDDIDEDEILFLKKKISKKTVETFFVEQIKKIRL
ncbi:MAG: nucleotidyl transferase AbiEii/AbiGii toxin family protein, partial [Candidatus Uhrbacteria bacterium]|nr:nucleotidyl transferase AbiEii/AbiGii toxin family protein [Candidatus Uhrbacteria bacterium]